MDSDALLNEDWELVSEKIARDKVVLVFNDVFDKLINSVNLVILQSILYGI